MPGINTGRVVIVTGAGGGIGRAHALAFAASGASVVVNDLGGTRAGDGVDTAPAQRVVDEIIAAGGQAVASFQNVASHAGAASLVQEAVAAFGDLHVLVNNAGILRDRVLVKMTEDEWDAVIAVHLKGTYGPSHHAACYWRERSKAGLPVSGRIINTSSTSGVFGNVGQANYGAAKAAIAAFTIIVSQELAQYGVTVNAIAPTALTRMTEDIGLMVELQKQRGSLSPDDVSPLVVWLGSPESGAVTGRVFGVWGGRITVFEGWSNGPYVQTEGRWNPEELGTVIPDLVTRAAPNAGMSGEPKRLDH